MNFLARLVLLVVLLAGIGNAHAARGAKPMIIPEPIAVPEQMTDDNVAKAIRYSLLGRGWSWAKSDEQPGSIDTTLNVRQHMLKVRINYGGGVIAMSYLDSAVLKYEVDEGVPKIHPNASKWMDLLAQDIRTNLAREQLE